MTPLKILLVNTGFRNPLHPLISPPLGIMYIAAYIRTKFNVDIRLINQKLNNDSNDAIIKDAIDFNADIIGLSVMTPAAHNVNYITTNIKSGLIEHGYLKKLNTSTAKSAGVSNCGINGPLLNKGFFYIPTRPPQKFLK